MEAESALYVQGKWIWDESSDCLQFIRPKTDFAPKVRYASAADDSAAIPKTIEFTFKNISGPAEVWFKKNLRRQSTVKPDVVTLQDVKDVALYTCPVSLLHSDFINFFHTVSMDNFLRSLIIYFQYFFQVWAAMQCGREEARRKLRQPIVTLLENIPRDDLADLRSVVAREYSVLLTGASDSRPFHHLNRKNKMSLSDRDRKLYETLMIMAKRVVFIALNRKHISLIDMELNRIIRTKTFYQEEPWALPYIPNPQEERVLIGEGFKQERKLLQRSPTVQEIFTDTHDFRMMAIGVNECQRPDPRQEYLEKAYTAPENLLEKLAVPVGILGLPRRYMDLLLRPKELATMQRRVSIMKPLAKFTIPPYKKWVTPLKEDFVKQPPKYKEAEQTALHRERQRKLWKYYVDIGGKVVIQSDLPTYTRSYNVLHTVT